MGRHADDINNFSFTPLFFLLVFLLSFEALLTRHVCYHLIDELTNELFLLRYMHWLVEFLSKVSEEGVHFNKVQNSSNITNKGGKNSSGEKVNMNQKLNGRSISGI